jgi:hypothetical protein
MKDEWDSKNKNKSKSKSKSKSKNTLPIVDFACIGT